MISTTDLAPAPAAGAILSRLLRPAVGFDHPLDVVKDPDLPVSEKRAILSSWASDACAVESAPTLRRLPGSDTAVPVSEVLAALRRLDAEAHRRTSRARGSASGHHMLWTDRR